MKARYFITLLLVGMFAVGVPVGVVADENLDGPVYNTWGEIESPLGTGAVISQDNPSQRSDEVEDYDPFSPGEFEGE